MKFSFVLISFLIFQTSVGAYATSEIDQEIDRLTVELQPAGHFNPHTKKSKRYVSRKDKKANSGVRVAAYHPQVVPSTESATLKKTVPAPAPVYEASADSSSNYEGSSTPPPQVTEIKPPRIRETSENNSVSSFEHRRGSSLFYRVSVLPVAAIATFDGGDSSTVIPHGVNNPYNSGVSGSILTDINFGSNNFVAETGVSYLRAGSYTAYNIPLYGTQAVPGLSNINDDEQVTLHYIGVPINLKWMLSGESKSSFYVKAGATPSMLVKSEYTNLAGSGYLGYRFGTFNSFDLIGNAAVGVDFSIYKNYGVVVEGGYYHGLFSVSPNYDIFNTGFTVGVGITYVL